MEIKGYNFCMTCPAFPEQYDVYAALGHLIAYVRLRHGHLSASIGGCSLSSAFDIYHHEFEDEYKGEFDTYEEREKYLTEIAEAIDRRCGKDNCYRTVAHYVLFESDYYKPVMVKYTTWKEDVTQADLQEMYDDLLLNQAEFRTGSLDGRVRRLMLHVADKVIEWEVIDYEEVC